MRKMDKVFPIGTSQHLNCSQFFQMISSIFHFICNLKENLYIKQYLYWKRPSGWLESWEGLLFATDWRLTVENLTDLKIFNWLSKRQSQTTVLLRKESDNLFHSRYVTLGFKPFSYGKQCYRELKVFLFWWIKIVTWKCLSVRATMFSIHKKNQPFYSSDNARRYFLWLLERNFNFFFDFIKIRVLVWYSFYPYELHVFDTISLHLCFE